MCNFIKLNPIKKINGAVCIPGSKSISNRALLLASQSIGTTRLTNLLNSDDTNHMLIALRTLGVNYRLSNCGTTCDIDGIGGPLYSKNRLTLFTGNAGTVIRPLVAALSVRSQCIVVTGDLGMKNRPIHHLVDALKQGGCSIDYMERNNYPPVCLYGGFVGGSIVVEGNISSQFLSSILMMAPLAPNNTCIKINGILVSKPYVDITLSLMKTFGVIIKHEDYRVFYCTGNNVYHSPGNYVIEGDATSASYFLAASAIKGGTVQILGVGKNSKQGDIYFAKVLEKMGAIISFGDNYIECRRGSMLRAIDIDANDIPDAAMTLAVTALFVHDGPTMLRNIYNWRIKESNRLTAMATELRKVGAIIIEGRDYLHITPPVSIKSATINTYNDHRIAMCCALMALSDSVITIINPKCVNKTFPDFFQKLFSISILR